MVSKFASLVDIYSCQKKVRLIKNLIFYLKQPSSGEGGGEGLNSVNIVEFSWLSNLTCKLTANGQLTTD